MLEKMKIKKTLKEIFEQVYIDKFNDIVDEVKSYFHKTNREITERKTKNKCKQSQHIMKHYK